MGLDLIAFTLALEDAFGVSIPDTDLVGMDTPRRVIDYLVEGFRVLRVHCVSSSAPSIDCVTA